MSPIKSKHLSNPSSEKLLKRKIVDVTCLTKHSIFTRLRGAKEGYEFNSLCMYVSMFPVAPIQRVRF